ncbi:hypothetical protein ACVIHI_002607 [Bradyrhizobium sp. USDA 4524]|uniref:hypothetical protein n=1 Tax=unclassified Bradyrhizobium TaxID=2631580 RepID=UPI0020A016FC|nr:MULTISPECIES: hypothetical protein [unclassified Bradyrhizobium]MCP1844472.1 hypothetical protein [Bradyrhizobium sp. USDA 4538]MCP1905038.1 hypothetical protein [Bradyrhizobium sp. USDA 4537]MCP1989306.1 hypothetical protein [Bradyrhizobium sp. USDA 4539]
MDSERGLAVSAANRTGLRLQWSPVIAGALAAAALSVILIGFGAAVGLGVSSSSPSWRDASAALALLSGLYLILQALVSFGVGGYIAGRAQRVIGATPSDEIDSRDGLHGLTAWALAVILGATIVGLVGLSTARPVVQNRPSATAAEPLLSAELDRLYRSVRRPANLDIGYERAEAGRILLTSSSRSGVSSDDRSYLIQQVAAATGLPAAEAEKRVDSVMGDARTAIQRSRRSAVILAFSVAAALLFGAVAAWAAAGAGGRHRDGAALPEWMGGRPTTAVPIV